MGLGGFLKGLGKGALKVAPYAAMAIPGVGPLASAGIQAGIGAAQTKAKGGSWKDALKGGAISGGTSFAMGKIPGLDKGLSPSKNFVKNDIAKVASKVGGGGLKNTLGSIAKGVGTNMGRDILTRGPSIMMDDPRIGGLSGRAVSGSPSAGGNIPPYGGRMPGIGPSVLMQRDQNFPNLAEALNAGRQEAINDQPWRMGYDITSYGPTEEQRKLLGPQVTTRTPPIGPRY